MNIQPREERFSLGLGLLVIISILFGMHLRYVALIGTEVDDPLRADARDYFAYAYNISEFGVYSRVLPGESSPEPDALRSPGFPFFASFFISETIGASITDLLWGQAVLQIICLLAFSYIIYRLLGQIYGAIAILLLWTFPHFVTINTYYLSESLFFSVLCLIAFFSWLYFQPGWQKRSILVVVGLLIGVGALVRPVLEYLPLFLLGVFCVFSRGSVRPVLWVALSAAIPILAWKIRNFYAIGSFSDSTLMANGLYHGSFPGFMFNGIPESFGFPYRFDPMATAVSGDVGATLAVIWERFVNSPIEYLQWYLWGKQSFLWQWGIVAGQGDIFIYPTVKSPYYSLGDVVASRNIHHLLHAGWVIVGALSAIGLLFWAFVRNKVDNSIKPWLLFSLIILYAALMHAVTAPFPRYGIPFKIFLIPLCLFGIKVLIEQIIVWRQRAQ